jgi:hypothetical protein
MTAWVITIPLAAACAWAGYQLFSITATLLL